MMFFFLNKIKQMLPFSKLNIHKAHIKQHLNGVQLHDNANFDLHNNIVS